jgi:hypothetical protein
VPLPDLRQIVCARCETFTARWHKEFRAKFFIFLADLLGPKTFRRLPHAGSVKDRIDGNGGYSGYHRKTWRQRPGWSPIGSRAFLIRRARDRHVFLAVLGIAIEAAESEIAAARIPPRRHPRSLLLR